MHGVIIILSTSPQIAPIKKYYSTALPLGSSSYGSSRGGGGGFEPTIRSWAGLACQAYGQGSI